MLLKKLPFVICVHGRYKTREMCNKAILENGGKNQIMCNEAIDNYAYALESVLICNKIATKLCNKAVNSSPFAMQFVPDCYKTRAMCIKAVDTFPFVFDSVPYQYKT